MLTQGAWTVDQEAIWVDEVYLVVQLRCSVDFVRRV